MFTFPITTITNGNSKIFGAAASDETLKNESLSGYETVLIDVQGVGATATVTGDYGNGFSGAQTVAHGEQTYFRCDGVLSIKVEMAGADAEVLIKPCKKVEQ